jgi:hypothetical protein
MKRVFDCLVCRRNQKGRCSTWVNNGKPDHILNCPDFVAMRFDDAPVSPTTASDNRTSQRPNLTGKQGV